MQTQTTTDLVPIIGWERKSTDHQDMARQDADLDKLKLIYPIRYTRIVKLELSGRHVDGDPDVQAVLDEIEHNRIIRGVGTSALDRLFRHERYDSGKILDVFKDNRKVIYSAKEGLVDPSTNSGYMLCMMAMMQSGLEWRELRRRTMDQKAEYRLRGWNVAGGPKAIPRGVIFDRIRVGGRTVGGTWRYDGIYSEKIRKAMYLIVEMGSNANYEEVVRRIGGGYTANGLKEAVQNRIWIGERVYDEEYVLPEYTPDPTKRRGGKKPMRKKRRPPSKREEPIVVKIELEPLVPMEIFERVQEIVQGKRANTQRTRIKNADRERFLGGGLMWCSCGKIFYLNYGSRAHDGIRADKIFCSSQSKKHHKDNVSCGAPRLKRVDVDRTLAELFTSSVLKADVIGTIEARLRAKHARKDTGKAAREKKLAELKDRRQTVNDMREYRGIDRPEWLRRIALIEQEEKEVLAIAPAPQDVPYDPQATAKGIAEVFSDFGALPFPDQRKLLKAAVSKIIIDTEKSSIMSIEFKGGWLTRVSASIGKAPGGEKCGETKSLKMALTPVIPVAQSHGVPTRYCPWTTSDWNSVGIPGPDLAVKLSKPLQIKRSEYAPSERSRKAWVTRRANQKRRSIK